MDDSGHKSFGKLMAQHVEEYCYNTTLHGLHYVGDHTLTFGERVFWLIAFSCAVGFGTYYIKNVYDKWNSSPVIISFSPFDAELSSIPFPAVTICNMNQAKKSEAERLIAEGDPVQLKLLSDVCDDNKYFNDSTQYNWTALSNFLIRTGSSCADMVKKCEWSGKIKNCDDIFNNYLTDEGLCCSFNRLPPNKIFRNANDVSLLNQTYPENVFDWNPETGFQGYPFNDDTDETAVPKRPLGAGAHLGLTVVIDAQIDNYYCSSTSSVGFKILFSNPIESPKMADYASLLRPGIEARYSIVPSVREASDKLRYIALEKRQCYFANEKNCCIIENHSIRYCGQKDRNCIKLTKRFVDIEISQKTLCNCYPECVTISYDMPYSFIKIRNLLIDRHLRVNELSDSYIMNNVAVVHFYFNQGHFDKQYKSNLYDTTDLIGNMGGLLSLFLGFSILGAIEFVYLLVWRFFWTKYREDKQTIPFLN